MRYIIDRDDVVLPEPARCQVSDPLGFDVSVAGRSFTERPGVSANLGAFSPWGEVGRRFAPGRSGGMRCALQD